MSKCKEQVITDDPWPEEFLSTSHVTVSQMKGSNVFTDLHMNLHWTPTYLFISVMFLLQDMVFDYLYIYLWSEVFSYMEWWSITDLNECCLTGGTAIFTQIHSDSHSSWECHQRSVGWPAWVLICLFFISYSPVILMFHVNISGRYMYVCVILGHQNVLRSMSATLFNMCVQWTLRIHTWNCSSQQHQKAEKGPST